MGLLFRRIGTGRHADDYVSNLDCAALRAMTGYVGERADMLLGIVIQLFKLCGAIPNFVHRSTIAAQRSSHLSTTF